MSAMQIKAQEIVGNFLDKKYFCHVFMAIEDDTIEADD